MKTVLALILLTLSSNVLAFGYEPLTKEPYDKASHAITGMIIRKAIGEDRPILGAAAVLAVGAIKESIDLNWDNDDFTAWTAGVKLQWEF